MNRFCTKRDSNASLPAEDEFRDRLRESATWASALGSSSSDRRFSVTEHGHVGMVPPGWDIGDVMAVFMGAYTPSVLRPRGGESVVDE